MACHYRTMIDEIRSEVLARIQPALDSEYDQDSALQSDLASWWTDEEDRFLTAEFRDGVTLYGYSAVLTVGMV